MRPVGREGDAGWRGLLGLTIPVLRIGDGVPRFAWKRALATVWVLALSQVRRLDAVKFRVNNLGDRRGLAVTLDFVLAIRSWGDVIGFIVGLLDKTNQKQHLDN